MKEKGTYESDSNGTCQYSSYAIFIFFGKYYRERRTAFLNVHFFSLFAQPFSFHYSSMIRKIKFAYD